MLTIDEVKTYLRVDGNVEDALIQTLMNAAESYMEGAITNYKARCAAAEDDSSDTWLDKVNVLKLKMIAADYEGRGMNTVLMDNRYKSLMLQLQTEGRRFKNA